MKSCYKIKGKSLLFCSTNSIADITVALTITGITPQASSLLGGTSNTMSVTGLFSGQTIAQTTLTTHDWYTATVTGVDVTNGDIEFTLERNLKNPEVSPEVNEGEFSQDSKNTHYFAIVIMKGKIVI